MRFGHWNGGSDKQKGEWGKFMILLLWKMIGHYRFSPHFFHGGAIFTNIYIYQNNYLSWEGLAGSVTLKSAIFCRARRRALKNKFGFS